ncbi:DMT family transporter [Lacunimicrobium album]
MSTSVMEQQHRKSLIAVHIAVLLFGISGPLGAVVSLPATDIVFSRSLIGAAALLGMLLFTKQKIAPQSKLDWAFLAITGSLLAAHWVTFFMSIQMAGVAVGLTTVSTFTIWVALLEPALSGRFPRLSDIAIAAVVILGVILVSPEFNWKNDTTRGAVWGIVSAILFAVLSLSNRQLVKRYSGLVVAFHQQLIAGLCLLATVSLFTTRPSNSDLLSLLILGSLCTAVPHALFIISLKHINTRTASLITCLEPVYGILLAALLISQFPDLRTLIGCAVILSVACYASIKPAR